MAKTIDQVLNEDVSATLGALQFQVIALRAENTVLKARLMELEPPPPDVASTSESPG